MSNSNRETITTRIWREVSEADNPFVAKICYCSGYDVFGDLLGKISWIEYLYLLFKLEPPASQQAKLLESLAVILANPGPRDHSVRAAMNAGVCGSPRASALMAALGVGAGNLNGAREIWQAMNYWAECGEDIEAWQSIIAKPPREERVDIWLPMEHTPGFDPNGESCPLPVRQALRHLADVSPGKTLRWLLENRERLEQYTSIPLAFSGVASAAFHDLEFSAAQAESLYLLLRLPGAAAHALEQEKYGWSQYPFFKDGLQLKDSLDDALKSAVGADV